MNGILVVVMVFLLLAASLGVVAYLVYQRKLRRAKAIERGLKMVPIQIHLPPPSADTVAGSRDIRDVMREKTAQAEVLYNLLAGTASEGFKSKFYGQRHIALEIVASDGLVHFYAAVPVAMVSVVEKSIQTAYPGALLEEVEDHNIFNQEGRLAATMGGEIVLKADSSYPISTYEELDRDPLEAIITTLSSMGKDDGAAIQVMVRPATSGWVKRSTSLVEHLRKGKSKGLGFNAMDVARAVVTPPTTAAADAAKQAPGQSLTNLQLGTIERIENKTKQPGFEVLVRLVVSTQTVATSQQLLRDLATAFALFEAPGLNGFKFLPAIDVQGLVTAFILRFFPPEMHSSILNSAELATLFHLPDSQFVPTANVERQASKEVDGPVSLPSSGLLFGFNEFRGVKKEIRLSTEDRRRHTYVLGQTGTGKSTLLENLAVQDMLAGNGFAFIDPHGDTAEKLLSLVPKERAEDVIYFNPADTEYPLGLNLFEFNDPAQKDFLIQETISMLYKLYDPNGTGVIGPRFEQWYRNAALTLMSDPAGATFLEIPKVFTDTEYLKQKFRYLKDPTVIDFWTKEMGQTSDYHKSEMLGYFVSKFGAFQQNEIMRNIIGQTKSAFDLRDIMDNKKILIVNLSKGQIGELNSKLLGMMFVIKFQAAAMSRADMPEADRTDFSLYVDEFQNFSTDSFASILSEARKYRLNLIVANQFIGQLTNEIRDAVFGNIGTILGMRMGPEDAEFMVKQFTPIFDARDLVNLPNGHAAIRMMLGGVPSQPFTIRGLPPLSTTNPELGLAIKQLSAAKFGASKAVIEADITARLSGRMASVAPPAPVEPAPATVAIPVTLPTDPVNVSAPAVTPAVMSQPSAPAPAPAVEVPMPTEPQQVAPAAAFITSPPPIGAPPVDGLSAPAPVEQIAPQAAPPMVPVAPIIPEPTDEPMSRADVQPAAASEPGGLSITDITGGRKLPTAPASPPAVGIPPIGAPPIDLPFAPSPVLSVNEAPGQQLQAPATELGPQTQQSAEAEALSDIPLIPSGSEPKPPVKAAPMVSDQPTQTTTRTRVIELADTPLADDPMATIPLIEDLRPISVVETEVVVPQVAPTAPEADVAVPAAVPTFDPTSMVALTPNERQQQPDPIGGPVAIPVPLPAQITPAPPLAPALEAPVITEPAQINPPTWSDTGEPEPRTVLQSEPDDEVDFSGSLVHFIDPKIETPSESPEIVVAPNLPEISSPLPVQAAPEPEKVPNQVSSTPLPIGAPPLGTTEPVTLIAPTLIAEPVTAAPPVPELEQVEVTPPPIGAPPIQIEPSAVKSADVESMPQVPEAPASGQEPAVEAAEIQDPPQTVVSPEITADPVAIPIPDAQQPPSPVGPAEDPAPKPDEVVEPPIIEPAPSAPAAAEEIPDEIVPEKVSDVVPVAPETSEPIAPAQLGTASETPDKPDDESSPEPQRSPEDLMAAVMEAARRRQAEREEVPAEASAPVNAIAEPTPEIAPEPTSDDTPALSPALPEAAPSVFTPEILDNLPSIDPVLATEDQIDDLLNTSIIHDSHPSSSRLPEPDENRTPEDDALPAVDEVVTSNPSAHHRLPDAVSPTNTEENTVPEADGHDHALTGGHKVIEPLEPIVSHQEEFAEELKKLESDELAAAEVSDEQAEAPSPDAPGEVGKPSPEPPITPAQPIMPVAQDEAPVQPPPALAPFDSPEPEAPQILPAEPVAMPEDDFGLPEAESLDAGVVAAARAKRESDELAAQAQAQVEEVKETPSESDTKTLEVKQEPEEAIAEKPARAKRKRSRNRYKPVPEPATSEVAQDQPEAAPNEVVAEPVPAVNPQAGNLIMPSADTSPVHNVPATSMVAARPEKLAKGEVFVDERGNVIVGE